MALINLKLILILVLNDNSINFQMIKLKTSEFYIIEVAFYFLQLFIQFYQF